MTNREAIVEPISDDLNHQMRKEAEISNYHAAIDARTIQLMQPGKEYYPWSFENFSEALAQCPDPNLRVIFATVTDAIIGNAMGNDLSNHGVVVALRDAVEGYWRKTAQAIAQRQIDEESKYTCHKCAGKGCKHCNFD